MIHTIVHGGMKILFEAFPAFWLLLFFSILLFGWLKTRKKVSETAERRFRIYLLTLGLGFILFAVTLGIASRILLSLDFAEVFERNPAFIEFEWNGKTTRLEGTDAVRSFKQLLDSGREVGTHHSHPVEEVVFRVASSPYRFFLGKDSQNRDEFWLKCHDPTYGPGEFVLRQFHSSALTTWLERLTR